VASKVKVRFFFSVAFVLIVGGFLSVKMKMTIFVCSIVVLGLFGLGNFLKIPREIQLGFFIGVFGSLMMSIYSH
jgi:hypothetical protein